jgi:hypothetical protein
MKLIFQKGPTEGSKGIESFALEEEGTKIKERRKIKMKVCENHYQTIVVFEGDDCPFCKTERTIKTIGDEVENTMAILKTIQMTAKQPGLKTD